jgi:hypothetical protein
LREEAEVLRKVTTRNPQRVWAALFVVISAALVWRLQLKWANAQ